MNESKTLRDLLSGVVESSAINTTISTATDLVRAVVSDDGTALKISISGGSGSSGSSNFPGDVRVGGNLYVTGNTYQEDQYITDELITSRITVNGSHGTSGWFPVGTDGNGVSLASGIVTYMSWPTVLDGSSGTSGENGSSGTSGTGIDGSSGTSGTGVSGSSGTSGESGMNFNTITTTAPYSGSTNDYIRIMSGTTQHVYLPSAVGSEGQIMIKSITDVAITVYPDGAETIDYGASHTLNAKDAVWLKDSEAGNWDVL